MNPNYTTTRCQCRSLSKLFFFFFSGLNWRSCFPPSCLTRLTGNFWPKTANKAASWGRVWICHCSSPSKQPPLMGIQQQHAAHPAFAPQGCWKSSQNSRAQSCSNEGWGVKGKRKDNKCRGQVPWEKRKEGRELIGGNKEDDVTGEKEVKLKFRFLSLV